MATSKGQTGGVRVHIPPVLRPYSKGEAQVVLEAADVASVLEHLEARFPGFRERILDRAGRPKPYVNLFVNEEQVRKPLALVPLSAGDSLYILPSIAGGLDESI